MRWYCTYCDRNYLIRMLALAGSLERHEQSPYTLFVLCLDELTRTMLNRLGVPNVRTLGLHTLETADPDLRSARATRSLVEYYWTLTPAVLLHLFERYPEVDRLTYLDADLFFFSDPGPMFDEAPRASVLIHGHRFAKKYAALEAFGTYNVGLLSFAGNGEALSILGEWRGQCVEWCFASQEDGKFGDQMYLNDWPERFPGVHVLRHPGVGIAPWNQNDAVFATDGGGGLLVNGAPLIFYHFHALDILTEDVYVPARLLHYGFDLEVLHHCYLPYVQALGRWIAPLRGLLPDFSCGMSHHGGAVAHTLLATLPAARVLSDHLQGFTHQELGDGWVVGRVPVEMPDTSGSSA